MTFKRVDQSYFITATVVHILMPLFSLPRRLQWKTCGHTSILNSTLSPMKLLQLTKAELVTFIFLS